MDLLLRPLTPRPQSTRWWSFLGATAVAYGCNVYTEELLPGADAGGGASTGSTSTGSTSTGSISTGSTSTGSTSTGGTSTGGASTGGASTGGTSTGGVPAGDTGGASSPDPTGGTATGGADAAGGVDPGATGGIATGGDNAAGGLGGEVGGAGGQDPDPTGGGAPATGGTNDGGNATGGSTVIAGYTVIDLVDKANNSIELADGEGYWYTFHDGGGAITPDTEGSDELVATELPEQRDGNLLGMHVVADDGFDTWGSGLGFDLDSPSSSVKNKYDVSRYTRLLFWARAGAGSFDMRVNVLTAEVVADTNPGGECTESCDDAYGVVISLDDTWQQYSIDLATPPLEQEGWGAAPDFNPASVLSIQLQAGTGVAFDIWIDDVQFYTE